jgi:glycosyltransferase involved in cell wall biosynthesis
MRILIHSNAPWVPSGYGQQVRLLLPRLKELGHEVGVSAFGGLYGSTLHWDGVPVMPGGEIDFGLDVLEGHAHTFGADLVITLMDFYKLGPIAASLKKMNVAAWLPIDCAPLGLPDQMVLEQAGARPIATSRFGQLQLPEGSLYIPHAVDTEVFKPLGMSERTEVREAIGLNDKFVIGICAANSDGMRKGFPEQFAAFAQFHAKYPESVLLVHSRPGSIHGLDLHALVRDMDIADCVEFSDPYAQVAGLMGPEVMAQWYSMCDIVSACSFAEGFGVPIIEAQACGTPVVCTGGSAMTELNPLGWRVEGSKFWNPVHRAWWMRPHTDAIAEAYEEAFLKDDRSELCRRVREFALSYDTRAVAKKYWEPALLDLAPFEDEQAISAGGDA